MKLHLDIETYSECDLKEAGLYRYAEDPSTELLCAAYAFDDAPVHIWIPREISTEMCEALRARMGDKGSIHLGPSVPADLVSHIDEAVNGRPQSGGEVRAHNAAFERVVLNGAAGRKLGVPRLVIPQMVCTAAKSRAHGLPGALGDVAAALGTHAKDDTARNTMLQLSKPRKPTKDDPSTRWTPANAAEKFVILYAYCVDDVKAERGVDNYVPDLIPSEQKIWQLDQRINDRGIAIDLKMVEDVQFLINEYKVELEKLCLEWTADWLGEGGLKPTQREKISDWIAAHGYPMADMQAESVLQALVDPKCPEEVRRLLKLYSTYGMKAVSKFARVPLAVCADGRIRGSFMYYGAGPGRWSSQILQFHNMMRPVIKDVDFAIDMIKSRDLSDIKFWWPNTDPMKVFASCTRGMVVAPKGQVLQALDFAGVESRWVAWIYDELWELEAFRRADRKEGPDNYRVQYGALFDMRAEDVDAEQRQLGKVVVLAFSFEGGANACVTACETYHIDLEALAQAALPSLPEKARESAEWMWINWELKHGRPTGLPHHQYIACEGLKQLWRAAHPATVKGWQDTADAAKLAVLNPGKVYAIPNKRIMFKIDRDWLCMRLPSGRKIWYFKPEVHLDGKVVPAGTEIEDLKTVNLTYMGTDTKTRRWMRVSTYGGKLTQNGAEGGCSDLLRNGMVLLEEAGYDLTMTVHDEGTMEIDEDFGSLEEATKLFTRKPSWAGDLPLAADGFREPRYKKK